MFLQIPEIPGLEEQIKVVVIESVQKAMSEYKESLNNKDYFTLKEAQEYIGVSNATFNKFRMMGLKVMEVDSVKRVSKKHIDLFMEENSH